MSNRKPILEGFLFKTTWFGMGSICKLKLYQDGLLEYYKDAGGFKFPVKTDTFIINAQSEIDLENGYLEMHKLILASLGKINV